MFQNLTRRLFNSGVRGLVVYFQFQIQTLDTIKAHVPSDRRVLWVGRHGSYLLDLVCTIYLMKQSKRTFRLIAHRSWLRFSWLFADDDMAPMPCIDTSITSFQKALSDGHDVIVYPGGILETIGGNTMVSDDCRYQTSWEGRTRFGELAIIHEMYVVPFLVQNQEDIYFKPLARFSRYLWKTFGILFGVPIGIGLLPFPLELVLHVGIPFCTRGMQPRDVVIAARTGIDRVAHIHQRATRSKVCDILHHMHIPTATSLLVLHVMLLSFWYMDQLWFV